MIVGKVKENKFGKMVLFIKVTGKMIWLMDWED
jgi:hypothetical protein